MTAFWQHCSTGAGQTLAHHLDGRGGCDPILLAGNEEDRAANALGIHSAPTCWQTIVPNERPTRTARQILSTYATAMMRSANFSIESFSAASRERPDPGRSGLIARCWPSTVICGENVLDEPPSPWMRMTASPLPSTSTS